MKNTEEGKDSEPVIRMMKMIKNDGKSKGRRRFSGIKRETERACDEIQDRRGSENCGGYGRGVRG
jgi:hypothetical protein